MDDNVEDCPVCLTTFDDALRRPRTLPCGHLLCTPCVNGLKEQVAVMCPTCRVEHALSKSDQFPINYAVEGFIRRLRRLAAVPPNPGKQSTAPAPMSQPAPRATVGLSRKTRSLLQDQEAKVLAAIRSCQEEQRQLAEYRTTLSRWGGRQQRLEDELQVLMDQSKGAREAITQEKSRVEGRHEEVRQREEALHTALQALRTAATRQEAYEVIEDADHLVEEGEEEEGENHKKEERLAVFPNVHVVTTIARVAEASRDALQAAVAAAAATETALEAAGTAAAAATQTALETADTAAAAIAGDSSLPADSAMAFSIADKLPALLAPPLTAKDLLSLTQHARCLLKAGLVFAVHDVEGESRHARISLEDDRLHLHSLQTEALPPPPHAVILKMSEVVPAAPPCKVFLDLGWPGSAARRMVVSLPQGNPRAKQFMLLCSGQQGPCYANSRLSRVEDEGQPGECVSGGNYDGRGGAALLPDFDQGKYLLSGKAGAVWWWASEPAMGAQFGITTRDYEPSEKWDGVFGEVVRGLEVLQEAAQHRPITEVTVVQCGVLLSV